MKKTSPLWKFVLLSVCSLLSTFLYAQQKGSIEGRVTGENNQPLAGASVTIRELNRGTAADIDGHYKIANLAVGKYTITVNFIGYQQLEKTLQLSGDETLDFTLQHGTTDIGEVVVIGYGTARKKESTGSLSTVTSKDFQKGSITTPEQLIAGKAPGVSITSNGGAPGSGSTIRIRGGASLSASNDPLIVIDGVPLAYTKNPDGSAAVSGVANPLSLINPNDIESMTILKDAASTAIYGSRASNGVILITTKKGKAGKPVFNFNTQFSLSKVARRVNVLSANQFHTLVDSLGTDAQKALLGTANTDWQDQIYQTGITSDNNLNVTGSVKNIPYRVSAGYLDQTGILKTDKMQRGSLGISLNPKFFDNHLKVDLNLKGAVTKTRFANQDAIGAAATFDPTQPVYAEGKFGGYYEWTKGTGEDAIPNGQATRNPVALLMQKNDEGQVERSYGNIQFDYSFHFLPELHANLNLGYDVSHGHGDVFIPAYAAQAWTDSGRMSKYKQEIANRVGEFYLNYNKDIKSIKSNINATAGYGYYDNMSTNYNYYTLRANGDTIMNTKPAFPYDKPRNTLISYYARLIYTFDGKYILAGSIRSDGSSRFAKDSRWGYFPSLAFTWRLKEEEFLKNSNVLSDLKLRLSYGKTGQQDGIANYSYLPVYALSNNTAQYQLGNSLYNMYRPSAYDSKLKWEQTAAYNVGVDYGFLKNRINGSIDFYYKKTSDLLSVIPIPVGSNFANQLLTNVGNVENRGIEFNINANAVRTSNFNWDIGFNFTYNVNKITKLTAVADSSFLGNPTGGIAGATGYNIQMNSVGYNTNSFFVYKQVYDANGKPIEGAYQDLNKDGIINQKDLYHYKSPFPKFILGFSTQLNYKQWGLNMVMRANLGNYMYNNVASNLDRTQTMLNPLEYLQNGTTDVLNTNFKYSQALSDYYVQNASFLKMDNIGLTYNLGKLGKSRFGLILNANCQNVFTVTKYTGVDPEIFGGIDNKFYPRPRIYTVGANLAF
ncbi:SusC/RagA family TonB-linked outer membrane protein [Danxiaibacter flavus]|uniref:SusC/RagA family TonB-linked outer membrane protein n=1 Tax=Danxiaibacter flavus TaxID=3049108 RepID=A0ABV3ZGR5_9BACT|nr:SusC/RagA family TonB-linked outer membrane protein [Chitinophagaceae bacterium DXS]